MQKKKIVLLCDDLRSPSGVGCQARYLALGLANTGKYKILQLGTAVKHVDLEVAKINENIVVKPIDGFGTADLYRQVLLTEKPDAFVIFTDPRFFTELFSIHDEIQQVCPIVYWHLWDSCELPPKYNMNMYKAVDTFLCINRPTYEYLNPIFGDEQVKWAPHAVPQELFKPLPTALKQDAKKRALKNREDHFVVGWMSRNAHRKRAADVMWAFKLFLDQLEKDKGHRKATLLMHTDPLDVEGPNLLHVMDALELQDSVVFSREHLDFEDMCVMYNTTDCVVSMSLAEGFGLGTLEAMMCGVPIVAPKTGGLTRQVVDHRDQSENGVAMEPDVKKIVGSQATPYIIEDVVSSQTAATAIRKIYDMSSSERRNLGFKARAYALEEFNLDKLISTWDSTLEDTFDNWKKRRPSWVIKEVT